MSNEHPNFAGFYAAWEALNKRSGATADIRRVASMDELLDLPAFYRLVEPFGWRTNTYYEKLGWQRLVFLINHVVDKGENAPSLGKALALGKVSEKRLFQVIRADSPNDILQLRRLLIQVKPDINWQKTAPLLWRWSIKDKRSLLEDFVLIHQD